MKTTHQGETAHIVSEEMESAHEVNTLSRNLSGLGGDEQQQQHRHADIPARIS